MRHVMLALALAACTQAQALTPAQVYAQVSPAVWRVTTYDADGLPLGLGSGVVVGPGAMVTNCHVLAKARRVTVRREKVTLDAKLELWDVQRDVCQLRVDGLTADPVVLGEAAKVIVGQAAFAIGNPRGLDLTMSEGLVSSVRKNDAGRIVLIQTSAAISGGSSGGGLFDGNGVLIGLTTLASRGDSQSLNFAIPVDWVRELPQRHARLGKATAASAAMPTDVTIASPTAAVTPPATLAAVRVDDASRLPFATDEMRARYAVFLTRPMPRAFVISEGGEWRQAWGTQPDDPSSTPADRAMRECEQANRGRCFVYAIDDRVVYRAGPAPVPASDSGTGR